VRVLVVALLLATLLGCQNETAHVEETPAAPSVEPAAEERHFSAPTPETPPSVPAIIESPNSDPDVDQEQKTAVRSLDEMLLFFPAKYPEGDWEPAGLDFEDVWFESADGTKLHGWYCPATEPLAVILFAHGNGGHLAHRAEVLKFLQTELNVSVMMFDYRGYGRSEGVPTVKGILQDARAAAQALAEQASVAEEELVLMGRSLGGAVMIDLATEIEPSGLIVECTFPSLKAVASIHYRRLSWLVPADKLNSAKRICEYKGPFLQSHGTLDLIIPFELGQALFEAANEPKQFVTISNGNHNTPQSMEYYETLTEFLTDLRN